jgi:hypothetical protein
MFSLNRLKGHTAVERTEFEGLGPALQMLEQFKERTFKVRGRGIRASHVLADEVTRFIQEELPGYYTYTTRVETFVDRHEIRHACIEIKGWIGLSRQMNRYNPFDITCTIRTETQPST